MKVGVFDSGIGGLSVAKAIERSIEDVEVVFRNDKANLPYGNKDPKKLIELALPILKQMEQEGCQIIVIACNTISTTVIGEIRENLQTKLITVEPMIEKATELTKTKTITVCATPNTLASQRYQTLLEEHAKHLTVIEPDCSDWAYLIEENTINEQLLREDIEPSLQKGSDVIILGCTHYHWIEEEIKEIVGTRATVLQPEACVVSELKTMIAQLG